MDFRPVSATAVVVIALFLEILQINAGQGRGRVGCHLNGWWHNQLGSYIRLLEDNPKGSFIGLRGMYYSKEDPSFGQFNNFYTQAALKGGRMTGHDNTYSYVASFPGGASGVWVGQCFESAGRELLRSTWLMRTPMPFNESWKSTRVGKDIWNRDFNPPHNLPHRWDLDQHPIKGLKGF